MVGHEMRSSLTWVYTIDKTSLLENFKYGWKHEMVANMATLFVRGILWKSHFLGNLKLLEKKLDVQRIPTWGSFFLFSIFFFILSAIPTIALNNLALGWNSWPTNTLLHHSPSCKPAPKCCTQSYDIQLGHSIDKGVLSTNRKVGMWDNHKPLTCAKHINFAWKNLRTSNTPFGWRMWLHGLFPRK